MAGIEYYTTAPNNNGGTNSATWAGWVQGVLYNGTADYGSDAVTTGADTGASWQNWTVTVRTEVIPAAPETPEARQAREVRQVEWTARQAKQAEEYKAAKERAERLLVEHLAPAQRAAYEKDRFFEVVAAKARYRIYHDGAVRRLGEDGCEVASYCIHPTETLPAGDLALAKKLLLESDEAAFRRIANESLMRA